MVEWVAASAILALLCVVFGVDPVASFMRDVAVDVATLFGVVLLAASLAFLWAFYTKADTDFYKWLNNKGALEPYFAAAGYVIAVSFFATACPILLKKVPAVEYALTVVFVEILALINLYTLVKNVLGLMHLNAEFNRFK